MIGDDGIALICLGSSCTSNRHVETGREALRSGAVAAASPSSMEIYCILLKTSFRTTSRQILDGWHSQSANGTHSARTSFLFFFIILFFDENQHSSNRSFI